MDFLHTVYNLVFNLKPTLESLFASYGAWFYPIMMLIVFCETGLVVTPFLPGDSLMFTVGALANMKNGPNLHLAMGLLMLAPLLGDNANYWLGRLVGRRVASSQTGLPIIFRGHIVFVIKKEYLDRTHNFYEKYGPKTVILARFVPIIRTFAPFVAGVGKMSYMRFLSYSVIGAVLWVGLLVPAGYYFGGVEWVAGDENGKGGHFEAVILAIIFISLLPALVEFIRMKRQAVKARRGAPADK